MKLQSGGMGGKQGGTKKSEKHKNIFIKTQIRIQKYSKLSEKVEKNKKQRPKDRKMKVNKETPNKATKNRDSCPYTMMRAEALPLWKGPQRWHPVSVKITCEGERT